MSDRDEMDKITSFYIQEDIRRRLKEQNVDIDDLSLNELLASERTSLANKRNLFALKRSLQASERTYSAWVRTGFSIVSAGVAFSGWLSQTDAVIFSNVIGSLLVIVGLLTFVYAWYNYYKTYKWLAEITTERQKKDVLNKNNLVTLSIITFMLLITSITAFIIIIF